MAGRRVLVGSAVRAAIGVVGFGTLIVLGSTGLPTTVSMPTPTHVTLYVFAGTVTDASGNPLDGAHVSDGTGNVVNINASGQYQIDETVPGTFTLTASKPSYAQESKNMTVLVPKGKYVVNFALHQ